MTTPVTNRTQVDPWRGFAGSHWRERIDVRDFILHNVTSYAGDESFLSGPSERTMDVFARLTLRLVENGLAAYGYELDPTVKKIFSRHRKTHNDGVFDAYTPQILAARKAGVITGLAEPDDAQLEAARRRFADRGLVVT